MASKQPEAVRELYAGWTRTRLNGEEQDNEHGGDLTRDPAGPATSRPAPIACRRCG
jgi:hypothetical protein